MQKYLEERDELTFDKIFNQKIGKCQRFSSIKSRRSLRGNILDAFRELPELTRGEQTPQSC